MSVIKADKKSITRLLKTAKGQIDGLIKMVEEDRYCIDISNQLMATGAILKKANTQVINAHLDSCIAELITDEKSDEKLTEIKMLIEKIAK